MAVRASTTPSNEFAARSLSTATGSGRDGRRTRPEYDAIIIGAGFSGLYQLHKLRDELGLNVRLLEKGRGIGGTWYWNRYPGARCDSESYYYCYSFNKEIEQQWEWTERYPEHSEIRKYLNFVADRLDLKRDIRAGPGNLHRTISGISA